MIRVGSRALRMTVTAPGLARLKYTDRRIRRDGPSAPLRDIVLRGPFSYPALELVGDAAQGGSRHRIDLSIRIEEADDPLGLLERLDQPIEQNAVKTTIVPMDAVFVVLEEGVHARLPAALLRPGS